MFIGILKMKKKLKSIFRGVDDLNNMFEFFKLKNGFDRVSVPKTGT